MIHSAGVEATLERPTPSRRTGPGSRIGAKAAIARAVLEDGGSIRKAAETAGISVQTAFTIKHQDIVPRADVEPIKRILRDRMVLAASDALDHITHGKLTKASALECMKVADLAMKNAGLAPPSVTESYSFSVSKYVNSTSCDSQKGGIMDAFVKPVSEEK